MIWGSILAWYLFLAGLSAGAYVTVAVVNIKAAGDAEKAAKTQKFQFVGRIIAPAAVIIGLLLLIVDAEAGFQHPLRFFYLLTNWTSVMTWGTAILSVFTLVACISALLALLKRRVPRALDIVGIILAICTAAYTGLLLGVVQTYPLWNNALLPVLFVVSGFSAGLAATFVVANIFARKETSELPGLKNLHLALPVVEILLIAILLYITAHNGSAGITSVNELTSGSLALLFWLGLVVIGLIVPLGLSMAERFVGHGSADKNLGVGVLEIVSGTGTLIGGFLLRYLILLAASPLILFT